MLTFAAFLLSYFTFADGLSVKSASLGNDTSGSGRRPAQIAPDPQPLQRPRTTADVNLGVAMGWTGVDMSTPLFSEGVHETDADPLSLF